MSRSILTAALLAMLAQTTAALADDADSSLTTIVVIGTTPLPGAEADPDRIAAPVQTATSREIDRSHATDITAYMNRTLGSVYVNDVQNNPLQPDINYRGYTASPLLGTPQGLSVYLDGVRLNQPFGDVVSWDLIPRAAIASMTLMPGSNPLFGLNTLGGALSLRTKDGFSDPGVAAQVGYGSHRRRNVEWQIGGHADSGLYGYATGNVLRDDGWRDDSPTKAVQVFGKFGWRDTLTDVALTSAYADTDLTGNGLQEQRFLARDYDSIYTKPDNTRNRSQLWLLTATHKLGDRFTLSGNAYYRELNTRTLNGDLNDDALTEALYQPNAVERAALSAAGYTGFPTSGENAANTPFPSWRCIANILTDEEPNEQCNGLNNRTHTRQHDAGVSLQASFRAPLAGRDNQWAVGAVTLRSRSHFTQSTQFGYLTPDRGIATVEGPGAFADGSQDSEDAFDARVNLTGDTRTSSVYVTDTLQLAQLVQLTVSGRYDHTTVENRDALTPGGGPGSLDGDHRFNRFNPAFGLTFSPSRILSAYLGYNQGSRAPSAIELGCADPNNPCRLPNALTGDPPLKQVVTQTFEAGVRGMASNHVAWNVGVFRADNRDDIMFVADDSAGFGYFRNFGKTRRQGAELGLKAQLGAFKLGGNYTLLDATYRTAEIVNGDANSSNDAAAPGLPGNIDVEPGDRIALVPRHILKSFAQWDVTPQFSATIDLIAIAGSYARGNENNEHEADGVYYLGPGKIGGYTVVNVGAEYLAPRGWTLFAQVDNLFDRRYFTASQLSATGFTSTGNFIARPFAAPVIDGERPLVNATFYAPGAPRAYWLGVKYSLRP